MSDTHRIALAAAHHVAAKYLREDERLLVVEAEAWLVKNTPEDATGNDPAARRRLGGRLRKVLETRALKRLAEGSGYEAHDVAWYTPGLVESLLEPSFDTLNLPTGVNGDEPARGRGDPATRGNLHVMLLDVQSAYRRLSHPGKALLRSVDPDLSVEEQDALRADALDEMCRLLGGFPGQCARGCKCEEIER